MGIWRKIKVEQIAERNKNRDAAAKSLQSCLTLCDPIDGSPPGSPVPGILQVRTLEWVAISFSNAGKWKVKVKSLSHVRLLATPWTAAHQAPPSMGFARQEYWRGVPLPSRKNRDNRVLKAGYNVRNLLLNVLICALVWLYVHVQFFVCLTAREAIWSIIYLETETVTKLL